MTTDQPQPTPGQHVWVEAKAVQECAIPGAIGSHIGLHLIAPDGSVWPHDSWDPKQLRWRPMPDETAAERCGAPDERGRACALPVGHNMGQVDLPEFHDGAPDETAAEPNDALMALYDAGGASPFAEFAEVADAIRTMASENIKLRIDVARARKDVQANKAGWGAEIERTKRLEDLRRDVVMAMCVEDDDEERIDEEIVARIRQMIGNEMAAAQEWAAAGEPLAAGVPVGSLPGEPGPGAYLIGDLLAVRWPGDIGAAHWCVQATGMIDGYGNRSWESMRRDFADKPMRRLLPRTEPTVATLEVEGEPVTLDAIRDVVREAIGVKVERRDSLLLVSTGDGEAVATVRVDGKTFIPLGELNAARAERDEARRERDDAFAIVGGQNLSLLAERAKLSGRLSRLAEDWQRRAEEAITAPAKHIWKACANYLLATIADEAQEPAQTPGGTNE